MARKQKRLNISAADRIIGIRPREKRDLLAGCNEPGKAWFQRDEHEFIKMYCRICKNADCIRARGAVSPWHTRMAEQVDYLLNDPNFSDLLSSDHKNLAQMAFEDISQKALRLEIARHNQDWEIPEGPTDGVNKVANPQTTDQFDSAVKALAKAKGKEPPPLERPQQEKEPAHFSRGDSPMESLEDKWEYDTQYPSSDGKRTYHVTLSKTGVWACACEGFKHRKKCKHLEVVRDWYEDQLRTNTQQENASPSSETQEAPPQPIRRDPRIPDSRLNTPMPQGGIMLDGSLVPQTPARKVIPAQEHDPWAPKKDRIVKPGAVITIKKSTKNNG